MVEKNEVERVTKKIQKAYGSDDFEETLDKISYSNNVCIEVSNKNLQSYTVNQYYRGCGGLLNSTLMLHFKKDFMESKKKTSNFMIKDNEYNGKILIKAINSFTCANWFDDYDIS